MKGKFVMIVGPSAAGKTELVRALLEQLPDSARLITTTTRQRRPGETDEYFFVSREEFEQGIKENDFLEYSEVYGNLYGPSRKVLNSFLEKYKYVFGIIDVQGARTLRESVPGALTIFIHPGSLEDLRGRMRQVREGTPEDELQKRLDIAAHEIALAPSFDHIVENKEGFLDEAVKEVMRIVQNP